MARLYNPNKFKENEVSLTIRLSRDMLEERELLDHLDTLNPKRVQSMLINLVVAGYYHLIKKSHISNREPQIRKKMAEITHELHQEDEEGIIRKSNVSKQKKNSKKDTPQSIEVANTEKPIIQTDTEERIESEDTDFIPTFLQGGFPQSEDTEDENTNSSGSSGLSIGSMFSGISG